MPNIFRITEKFGMQDFHRGIAMDLEACIRDTSASVEEPQQTQKLTIKPKDRVVMISGP